MRFYAFILIAFTMTSCGCGRIKKTPPIHDAELAEYTTGFPADIDHISIEFAELDNRLAGLCRQWNNGRKLIQINKDDWVNRDDTRRRQLMWHELGHCALQLKHNNMHISEYDGSPCDDVDQNYSCRGKTPLSIMRHYTLWNSEIEKMCKLSSIDDISYSFCIFIKRL